MFGAFRATRGSLFSEYFEIGPLRFRFIPFALLGRATTVLQLLSVLSVDASDSTPAVSEREKYVRKRSSNNQLNA
jgi:hypothetical protein